MSMVYSHAVKYSQGETRMDQEMDSNIGNHCHQQNSGLMRYRSAPSSLLTSLVNNNNNNNGCVNAEAFRSDHNHHHPQQHYPPTTSSEMETMFAKLISSPTFESLQVKQEAGDSVSQQQHGYSYESSPQIRYQTQQIEGLSMRNGSIGAAGNGFDGSFSAVSSVASHNPTQTKMGSSTNCSNLIRQKSSPAGFFANYSVDHGIPLPYFVTFMEFHLSLIFILC